MSRIIMNRPEKDEHAPYYEKYVSLVPEDNILSVLEKQLGSSLDLFKSISEDQADKSYEPGKWSIKELLGHLIDSERIFAYRALRFARNDKSPLASFEQDDYISNANFGECKFSNLVSEYEHLRRANLHLFQNLTHEAWLRRGTASNAEVSVRALAYIIAGHERHHLNILKTRYL
jgi:hypothetical protein